MAMQTVLILGATGHIGPYLVAAAREAKKDVRVLLRPETATSTQADKRATLDAFQKQGATFVEGAIEDTASLERACRGVDAVISCVNGPQLQHQVALAEVARKAGARRFIPSEFGLDVVLTPKGSCLLFDWKRDLHEPLQKTGIAVTYVYSNGFFPFWAACLGQLGLVAPPEREIEVFGEGNVKMALLSMEDIAAYTVCMLDEPKTENREVSMLPSVNLVTQEELIRLWERLSQKKLHRRYLSAATLDRNIAELAAKPEKMGELIYAQIARSAWIQGIAGKRRADVLEATELFPQRPPVTVEAYLRGFLH